MMDKKSFIRETALVGSLAILVGLTILVWTLYRFDRSPQTGEWTRPAGELLESIGVSAIVFGIFNILVGLPDWTKYFEKRLQNIVLDYGYLASLAPDQLRTLQRELLKAMFKDKTIDREGSFVEYFDRHLHKYLGQPFREKVRGVMTYEDTGGDTFLVHDYLSYVLRASGGALQENVRWQNDPEEMVEVVSVNVGIRYPEKHDRAGETECLEMIDSATARARGRLLVECSLDRFRDVDRLIIEVEAMYRVKKSRFQYWDMAGSTRDFSLTINHPRSFAVTLKGFVHNPELTKTEVIPGRYYFECESWMLPNSGVVWRLEPIENVQSFEEYVQAHPLACALPPRRVRSPWIDRIVKLLRRLRGRPRTTAETQKRERTAAQEPVGSDAAHEGTRT